METELGLAPLADWFVTSKRLAGRSEFTLRLYRRVVMYLDAYLEREGLSRSIEDITSREVQGFIEEYRAGHAASSTETSRGYLSSFFKWAMREELITRDPMSRVPTIRVPESSPHMVTDEEFVALLAAASGSGFTERRDTAMLRVLESTGCRRGELSGALIADLSLDTNVLGVVGKGARPRTVAFDDETANALRHYLRVRARHPFHLSPFLFLGPRGAMAPIAVYEMLARRCRQAGINAVNPHAFRHRWAHLAKSSGMMSDETIKSLGGWSSSTFLEKYGRSSRSVRAVSDYQRWRSSSGSAQSRVTVRGRTGR